MRYPSNTAAETRPNCQAPEACVAKGAGHCRSCHLSSVAKTLHADPEFKAKTAERMRALHADPEFKAKAAERMRALHADPEFKAKTAERMRALHADPEFKAKTAERSRERMKALNADPEFKAKTAERMRALHADPEFKAKAAERSRERMKALNAEKIKRLGLRDEEVSDWRIFKAKGLSSLEAAEIVIASRRERAA